MPPLTTRPQPPRRRLRLLPLLLACLLPAAATLRAGEAMGENRRQTALEIKRGLNADFLEERIRAIRDARSVQDPEIVRHFELEEALLEVARDPRRFSRERAAALDTLAAYLIQGVITAEILPEILRLADEEEPEEPGAPLPMLVRYHAIDLLADMGGTEGQLGDRAYRSIREMMNRNWPPALMARVYGALGGFYTRPEVEQLLLRALRRENDRIARTGALEGLHRYLELSGTTADAIGEALARHIRNLQDTGETLQAIKTLELWVRNGGEINARTNVSTALRGLIETGGDEEAQAAVRLLYKSEPLESVDTLLAYAAPSARGLSIETLLVFNKALTETMNLLKEDRRRDEREAAFERIRDHFLRILAPDSVAPLEIKTTAAFGLGNIPIEFDRSLAVEALIRTLAETEERALVEEIESSLRNLTLQEPFRTVNYGEGGDRLVGAPNIDRWEAWLEKNMEYLLPDEAPWMKR